jgi:hypothetical protein
LQQPVTSILNEVDHIDLALRVYAQLKESISDLYIVCETRQEAVETTTRLFQENEITQSYHTYVFNQRAKATEDSIRDLAKKILDGEVGQIQGTGLWLMPRRGNQVWLVADGLTTESDYVMNRPLDMNLVGSHIDDQNLNAGKLLAIAMLYGGYEGGNQICAYLRLETASIPTRPWDDAPEARAKATMRDLASMMLDVYAMENDLRVWQIRSFEEPPGVYSRWSLWCHSSPN